MLWAIFWLPKHMLQWPPTQFMLYDTTAQVPGSTRMYPVCLFSKMLMITLGICENTLSRSKSRPKNSFVTAFQAYLTACGIMRPRWHPTYLVETITSTGNLKLLYHWGKAVVNLSLMRNSEPGPFITVLELDKYDVAGCLGWGQLHRPPANVAQHRSATNTRQNSENCMNSGRLIEREHHEPEEASLIISAFYVPWKRSKLWGHYAAKDGRDTDRGQVTGLFQILLILQPKHLTRI